MTYDPFLTRKNPRYHGCIFLPAVLEKTASKKNHDAKARPRDIKLQNVKLGVTTSLPGPSLSFGGGGGGNGREREVGCMGAPPFFMQLFVQQSC